MASDFEKPDKVHTLWENEVPEKMWPLEARSLLWVGKKTEERLMAYGIRQVGLGVSKLTHENYVQMTHERAKAGSST